MHRIQWSFDSEVERLVIPYAARDHIGVKRGPLRQRIDTVLLLYTFYCMVAPHMRFLSYEQSWLIKPPGASWRLKRPGCTPFRCHAYPSTSIK